MNRPIAFFLFPGFQLVDLGAMTVFDLANSEYGGGPYDLRIVSAHGTPMRSAAGATLQTQAWRAAGHKITTIEAIGATQVGQRVQKAWAALDVPQCGYCQSGQVMAAAALLKAIPKPTDTDIDQAMSGNICHCGTYQRIRLAIHKAAGDA